MDNNYNQNIWQQTPTPTPDAPNKPNYDTPALVLGIVSAVFALISSCVLCCAPIVFITGPIGIIFVIVTTKNGYDWNATRIVALVLNVVAILGLILLILYTILWINSAEGQQAMNEFWKFYNQFMSDPSSFGSPYYE